MAGWGDGGTELGSLAVDVDDEGRGSRWKDGKRKIGSSTVLGRHYWSGNYKWIGIDMEQGEEDIIHSNEERLLKRPGGVATRKRRRDPTGWKEYCQWASGWHGNIEVERRHHRRLLGIATTESDWMRYSPITAIQEWIEFLP